MTNSDALTEAIQNKIKTASSSVLDSIKASMVEILSMSPQAPCWCRSKKKFFECHLYRADQRKLTQQEILHAQMKSFQATSICSADFDKTRCTSSIIGAHTIQHSKVLQSFAKSGHVGTFYRNTPDNLASTKTGITKQASVFNGFCSFHDTNLFAPIELHDLSDTTDNCWRASYRAICHELYQKKAALHSLQWRKLNIDKGRPVLEQLIIQDALLPIEASTAKGLRDVQKLKSTYETHYQNGTLNNITSYVIKTDQPIAIASSGTVSPMFDLKQNPIQNIQIELQHFSIATVTQNGNATFVLSHLNSDHIIAKYLNDVMSTSFSDIKNWLYKTILLHIENTFFDLSWWSALTVPDQTQYALAANNTHYDSPVIFDDFPGRLVLGNVTSFVKV